MKKIIVSTAFLLVTAVTVWANDGNQSSTQSFSQETSGVAHHSGLPLRSLHNILSDQLPTSLRTHIKDDYQGYWITELYEEKDHRQSSYFITLENADQVIKLKAIGDENWVVTDTVAKDQ